MKEITFVEQLCKWLKNQGYDPQTNVLIGKKGRRIEVDIYCERGAESPLAIEVKTDRQGMFDGIGKAFFYTAYTDCEVWLAVPSSVVKHLKKLNREDLPFQTFDITHMELIKNARDYDYNTRTLLRSYICPICGEKVGNVNNANWLNIHLEARHTLDLHELKQAIRTYKLIQQDEVQKAKIARLKIIYEQDEE